MDNHPAKFVHLHLHTQYSLLDGAIRLEDLFEIVTQYGMPAVAMTDHGNLYGAVDFFLRAKSAEVKPIIGSEIYVSPTSYRDREPGTGRDSSNHLVLLVENREGYKNLSRLVTNAHLEGFYYKPRVDKELLAKYNGGLIALSACLKGEIASKILAGDMKGAREVCGFYKDIFPKRFYLELMENGMPEQRQVNRALIELAREMDLPLVATNDCHYLRKEDAEAHDVLLCIQTGKTIKDQNRMRLSAPEFYVKSADEMAAAFSEVPEAITNTLAIAERCNFSFTFGKFQFPEYPIPDGLDVNVFFENETKKGFGRRIDRIVSFRGGDRESTLETYEKRLKKEVATIQKMGFAGYFLIVSDFINYAKKEGIPVGPGRGSAAGSLVAYCLGITDIDPMPYELLFERFLNPERISMPDIDIDFCKNGRDEVIRYVSEKYGGEERVAQIITFGKMQARAVIRDVGRALDMSYPEVDAIAKLIPTMPLNITLEDAVRLEPRLKELTETDEKIARLIEIAKSLEGLNRHASTHAAGVVISNLPLVEYMPLTRGQKGEVVTQFDMKSVEKLGLIKFDFLGLRTLTVIDHAIRLIEKNRGVRVDISTIPLDDQDTYGLLQSGNTNGVFQLEGSGMKDLMVRLVPEKFEELIALVALYRPGPLNTGMAEEYIKRKHNPAAIKYELSDLGGILGDTYGVMVYQEQVMQIATVLADFAPADSDLLRRAMGKKIRDEMAAQKKKFISGAVKKNIEKAKAEKIFKQMEEFAEYGFNKSHSAAYALVAYQTAYLKTHFPVEFMAALLTSEMDDTDKIMQYIGDCREMGIEVLPPNINESDLDFTVVNDAIRFGLAAVKNVGAQAIDSIVGARNTGGPFSSLYDFARRVDLRKVNKRVVESLVKCGAFDFSNISRSKLMGALDRAVDLGQRHQEGARKGQMSIFDAALRSGKGEMETFEEYPDVAEWSESKTLANEKESLGFYITGHPLSEFKDILHRVTEFNSVTVGERPDKSSVAIGGVVAAIKEILTKKGERMAFVTIEDMKGMVEVVVFSDVYKRARQILTEDAPILVEGTLDRGEDTFKILAREITSLKEAVLKKQQKVYINIKTLSLPLVTIERLREITTRNPGGSPLYFRVFDEQEGCLILSMPENLKVDPTESFISDMNGVLGEGTVTVA